MIRKSLFLLFMITMIIAAFAASAIGDSIPNTLVFAKDQVSLENCSYSAGAALGNLSGSGTLKITGTISGGKYNHNLGTVQFTKLSADSTGQILSGNIPLSACKLTNLLGSNLDIDAASGSVKADTNSGKRVAGFEFKTKVNAPLYDTSGNQLSIDFSNSFFTLDIDSTGQAVLRSGGGAISKGVNNSGEISACGMKIRSTVFTLSMLSSPVNGTNFNLECDNGTVWTNMPQLSTFDNGELVLRFKQLVVDQDGMVTCKDFSLGQTPTDIALANPADFILDIVSANIQMDKGVYTKFAIQANVILPKSVTDAAGQRDGIPNVDFDLLKPAVVEFKQTARIPELFFNGGYHIQSSTCVIDFSREGPADLSITPGINSKSWQGIYMKAATALLPPIWSDSGGNPISIPTTNVYIETNGVSCDIEAPVATLKDMNIGNFNCHLKRLHIIMARNTVTITESSGSTTVQGLGSIELNVNVTDLEPVVTAKPNQALKSDPLGMHLNISSGQLLPGPDSNYALWLNGAMVFSLNKYPSLAASALMFHNLGINNKFNFVFNTDHGMSLDAPADVDFGLFKCNISEVALVQDGNKWVADFNGALSLNSDIPVSSTVTYNRLRVSPDGSNKPMLEMNGIVVEAEILNVVRIDGTLDKKPQAGGGECLIGGAKLTLLCAGDSAPMSGTFQLYIGDGGVWGVAGRAEIPTPILLGNTGLALYAFKGGVAHNMTAPEGFENVADLKPALNSGKWLFMAGAEAGTSGDPDLFYASGTLTIGLPNFTFDLRGKGWVLTSDHSGEAPLQVAVFLDPTVPLLRANADVNLSVPPGLNIFNINGSMELLLSPDDVHLAVGWPYPDQACSATVLTYGMRGGLLAQPLAYTVAAGTSFSYWPFSGSFDASLGYNFLHAPYLSGHAWASGSVDFWVASIGASADLAADLYDDGMHCNGTFTAEINMPWPIPDFEGSVGLSCTLP